MNTTKVVITTIILLFGIIVFNLIQINRLNKNIDELVRKTTVQDRKMRILKSDVEDFKEEIQEYNELEIKRVNNIKYETELNKNEQELQRNILQNQIDDIENEQY